MCCGLCIYVDGQCCSFLPSPLLREWKAAFSSSAFWVLSWSVEQSPLISAWLSDVRMEAKLLLSEHDCLPEEDEVRCQAWLPGSMQGAGYRLQCGYNLVFLLVQSALLDFYLKTILMSKTKPQKHVLVRHLQSCLCFCRVCSVCCRAQCFALLAGELFPASSVHVSCWIQGLSFANSAEIPATEPWERNWKWVCHRSALLCQRAWTVVP